MNYFSVEVILAYTCIKLSDFQPPKLHKCYCSHRLHICDSSHTYPLMSLQ